jgi:hypothetical protein
MSYRKTIMQATSIGVIVITAVSALTIIFGQRIAGQFMAWQENRQLRDAGADPHHLNPPAQSDSFVGKLSPVWAFNIINGAGQIGRAPGFHNTSISLDDGLTITQNPDPDFELESAASQPPASQRYNNATLIGFQGYQPTPGEDVLIQARMQVSPNFYGSAGLVLEPQGTILEDGIFQGRFRNQAFTFFGISFLGPESELFGKNGATVERVVNWWPEEVQGLDVDMHELHTYLLRLHWIDEQTWQGITSVDGQVLSRMNLPPLGPLEIQLWGDNYALQTSPFNGTPRIGFQNGATKWVRFEQVSAWTETTLP